jgi:hypothetical protein
MGWGSIGARTLGALSAAVLAAAILLATPVAASADESDDHGKSSAVAACKKGGWATLAPEDDPAHPFRNQGECVQYLAQDGAPVTTTGTPAQLGGQKGCKAAKAKMSHGAKAPSAESHGKACKPRAPKSHGHKAH